MKKKTLSLHVSTFEKVPATAADVRPVRSLRPMRSLNPQRSLRRQALPVQVPQAVMESAKN